MRAVLELKSGMTGFITKPMVVAGITLVFIMFALFGVVPELRGVGDVAVFGSWALGLALQITLIVLVVKRMKQRRMERLEVLMS